VPTRSEAQIFVTYLIAAERVDPKPDGEVIDFYAREMIALAAEANEKKAV
jgi:hypothetical protein